MGVTNGHRGRGSTRSPTASTASTRRSTIPGAGGFTFNQYLIVDDEPLLFHTGPAPVFPLVREAVARVMPVERLRWIAFSHFEADECGALNELLAAAPHAVPLCGRIAAMVSVSDFADRPPRALADGEELSLGRHTRALVRHAAPAARLGVRLPHRDDAPARCFCGDLFTQGGAGAPPLTEADILGAERGVPPADGLLLARAADARALLERLAAHEPATLACMHGSAWRGDGAALLRALGESLAAVEAAREAGVAPRRARRAGVRTRGGAGNRGGRALRRRIRGREGAAAHRGVGVADLRRLCARGRRARRLVGGAW